MRGVNGIIARCEWLLLLGLDHLPPLLDDEVGEAALGEHPTLRGREVEEVSMSVAVEVKEAVVVLVAARHLQVLQHGVTDAEVARRQVVPPHLQDPAEDMLHKGRALQSTIHRNVVRKPLNGPVLVQLARRHGA